MPPATLQCQSKTLVHHYLPLADLESALESLQLESCSKPILIHERNLAGIVTSHTDQATIPRLPPAPTLGEWADEYIIAHGYDLASICIMADALQQAENCEAFCRILAAKHMSVAEAHYIYKLTSRQS